MNITILGTGEVGEYLCQYFSTKDYNITLIDNNQERLERITSLNDVQGVLGDGTDLSILEDSEINKADIFIAVASNDEVNIVSSIMAKKLGAKYSVARLRNPIYSNKDKTMSEVLDIDLIINPEFEAAKEIFKLLRFPNILSVNYFYDGKITLLSLNLKDKNPLIGISLKDIHDKIYKNILIPIVVRDGITYIPKGDFILQSYDIVYFFGENDILRAFFNKVMQMKEKKNIMVVGGGIITYYLLKELLKFNFHVKIIEKDKNKAEFLSYNFPSADIICADGTNQDILEEERISSFDVFISLMDIDEENIISSIFAQHMRIGKTITKINRTRMLDMVVLKDIGSVITPKNLTSDIIVKFIRNRLSIKKSKIEVLHRIVDNCVDIIEFEIDENNSIINIPLKNLDIKENTMIVYIIRNGEMIIPFGEDYLKLNDKILLLTMNKNLNSIEDIVN